MKLCLYVTLTGDFPAASFSLQKGHHSVSYNTPWTKIINFQHGKLVLFLSRLGPKEEVIKQVITR